MPGGRSSSRPRSPPARRGGRRGDSRQPTRDERAGSRSQRQSPGRRRMSPSPEMRHRSPPRSEPPRRTSPPPRGAPSQSRSRSRPHGGRSHGRSNARNADRGSPPRSEPRAGDRSHRGDPPPRGKSRSASPGALQQPKTAVAIGQKEGFASVNGEVVEAKARNDGSPQWQAEITFTLGQALGSSGKARTMTIRGPYRTDKPKVEDDVDQLLKASKVGMKAVRELATKLKQSRIL
mmetsp:Transcript_58334/g.162574  ORF Transcript_58334/g.162574 Transcript_58334/m.162574 type:complete len:234 (-) Transcript_58334:100-801(-)